MKRSFCAAVLLAASLSACLHTTYTTGKPAVSSEGGWNHFFLWGLVNDAEIEADKLCPNGVSKITVYQSFVSGLVSGLTLGIYTPRSYDVGCSQ